MLGVLGSLWKFGGPRFFGSIAVRVNRFGE